MILKDNKDALDFTINVNVDSFNYVVTQLQM